MLDLNTRFTYDVKNEILQFDFTDCTHIFEIK